MIDFDHIEGDVRKVWDEAFAKLSDEDQQRILFVYVTPSGHGLKVVFMADPAIGNLISNQIVLSLKMGLTPDKSCSDGSRGAFLTTIDDVIFIDKEKLINYESLSVLLTLIRLVLIMVLIPPFKLLEKTNSLYQESMEETCEMLSL